VRKGGEGARGKSPKARKSPFTEVDKKSLGTIEAVLGQPKSMKVVAIGESIYGYPADHWADIRTVCEQMSVLYSGVRVGELFGRKFKPDHALALSVALNKEAFNVVEVSLDDALHFLRREELTNIGSLAERINLLTYESQPIGFAKRIGGRTNNLMPKELRILQ
jgi:NOL1/NOP2/fmu family ribosome biogenesis protein